MQTTSAVELEGNGVPPLLACASALLAQEGVERPRWTAEQLLSRRLGCRAIKLYLEPPPMDATQRIQFEADLAARVSGVPLQYLLGTAPFYGREFLVGPGVFIPRPETEILVEVALESLRNGQSVVDIGTGCGTIAVTLALECPHLKVTATDISSSALFFARRNAMKFEANVSFLKTDLLEGFQPDSVDFIVANLPYLDSETISRWPKELTWEPYLSLDGGEKGLSVIRKLIHPAASSLRSKGRLILEIGEGQVELISAAVEGTPFQIEKVAQDLNHLDRVMVLWKN